MELRFKLTEADYINFNIYHSNHSKTGKRLMNTGRVGGPVVFILAVLLLRVVSNIPVWYWSIWFCITGGAWIIWYPRLHTRNIKGNIKKMLSEDNNQTLLAEKTVVIDDEGIHSKSDYKESKTTWKSIVKASSTDEYVFLYESAISAHIIPVRAFISEEQRLDFLKYLKDRGL